MAKILGEAGKHVTDESVKRSIRGSLVALISVAFFALCCGLFFGLAISKGSIPGITTGFASFVVTCFACFFASRWVSKTFDRLERKRISFRKGAVGEAI